MKPDQTPVCLSGGADGADLHFGFCADWRGDHVIHWVFEKHRSKAPRDQRIVLADHQLVQADPALLIANRSLRRQLPRQRPFVMNLLRRNYFQIKDSDSVYAVASLDRGQVSGGTAWAVQMFLDRFEASACPCYLFDQLSTRWHVWDGQWTVIEAPPPPSGVYAGIGSRILQPSGRAAVAALYGYTPPPDTDTSELED